MNSIKKFILLSLVFLSISCKDFEEKKNSALLDVSIMEKKAKNYIQNEDYLKAKLIYDTLITIDSTKGEYYFKRGYTKSLLINNDNEAILDYHKAISKGYRNKHSAYLSIGMLYKWNKKFDSSLHYFDECLKLDPENSNAKKEKAEVMLLLNNSK